MLHNPRRHIVVSNRSSPNIELYGTLPLLFPFDDILHLLRIQMIRRNPTLIPMSDADVEDVRKMVAKNLETLQNLAKVQSLPGMSEEGDAKFQQLLYELKAKRLGLKPGVFNNAFENSHLKFIDKSHRITMYLMLTRTR